MEETLKQWAAANGRPDLAAQAWSASYPAPKEGWYKIMPCNGEDFLYCELCKRFVDDSHLESERHMKNANWKRTEEMARGVAPALLAQPCTAPPRPEEQPLPAHWSTHWSEVHNQYFFYDASTKTSSWQDPRLPAIADGPAVQAAQPYAPAESASTATRARIDAAFHSLNGDGSAQSQMPVTGVAAARQVPFEAGAEELPPNWTKHWSAGQNRHYYFDKDKQTSQWDAPVMPVTTAEAQPDPLTVNDPWGGSQRQQAAPTSRSPSSFNPNAAVFKPQFSQSEDPNAAVQDV